MLFNDHEQQNRSTTIKPHGKWISQIVPIKAQTHLAAYTWIAGNKFSQQTPRTNNHSNQEVKGYTPPPPPLTHKTHTLAGLFVDGWRTPYVNKHPPPPGRIGGQPGHYQPNGHSRPTSTTDFANTARLSFRSVLESGIDSIFEQADSVTPGGADVPTRWT